MSNFLNQVGRKLKAKVINGKYLNGSMFLQLALEYTEAINSKETPTILTALDRVVQAETIKILDEAYDAIKSELNEKLGEEQFPITEGELRKIVKKATKQR